MLKIAEIHSASEEPWMNSQGTAMYFQEFAADDGNLYSVMAKSPNKWNVGDEFEIKRTTGEKEQGGQIYTKASISKPGQSNYNNSSGGFASRSMNGGGNSQANPGSGSGGTAAYTSGGGPMIPFVEAAGAYAIFLEEAKENLKSTFSDAVVTPAELLDGAIRIATTMFIAYSRGHGISLSMAEKVDRAVAKSAPTNTDQGDSVPF